MLGVTTTTLVIPARFNGPPGSGNGGWVAGTLAGVLPGAAAVGVRLSAPPPLDVPLDVVPDDARAGARGVRLERDGQVLATAVATDAGSAAPHDSGDPFVPVEDAEKAAAGYPGAADHPYPECFACSPARTDGLRLTPARPPGGAAGTVATPWRPDGSIDDGTGRAALAAVWAALDCPGGWASDVAARPMVLGTVTGTVLRRPEIGEPCVVTATARGGQGRKAFSTTTLWAADGERLAAAAAVWVAVGA